MTPVATLRGQTRRAVRPRRLGPVDRARAGRRRRRGRRLGRQRGARAKAAAAGFARRRSRDGGLVALRRARPGARRAADPPEAALDGASCAQAAGVEIIGDIELFCRERARMRPRAPFVAITGTNGKSTTTALIAHHPARRRARRADRRQYRHADPRSRAAAPRVASTSSSARPSRSISRRASKPSVGLLHQPHAGPSRPPRHDGELRRHQGAAGRGMPTSRWSASTTTIAARSPTRLERERPQGRRDQRRAARPAPTHRRRRRGVIAASGGRRRPLLDLRHRAAARRA